MPEPDPPHHPSCWAWTHGGWRKGRILSDQPISGSVMGPGWDPGDDLLIVHTWDGFYGPVVARHVIVAGEDGLLGPEPVEAPEDWEPDQEEPPAFLG